MRKALATFSGKFGDILWSLPAAREISKAEGGMLDFAVMPAYESLLPLLNYQDYIQEAMVLKDWACTGSPHGDQPWEAPVKQGEYERVYHLTYRQHPGMGCPALPLAEFTAWQQHLHLSRPVAPFLQARRLEIHPIPPLPVISYAFNGDYFDLKQIFLAKLILRTSGLLSFCDVSQMPWMDAASQIDASQMFIGCRSACWVLACGLGVKNFTFEPNPNRHAEGPFGKVFSGLQENGEFVGHKNPSYAADQATEFLLGWRDRYWLRERKGTPVT